MDKGSIIKRLREEKGFSQVELARKIGVSKQTLYKYEKNIVTNIPSDKIEALAKALGTTPEVLMGWTEPPKMIFHMPPMPESLEKEILKEALDREYRKELSERLTENYNNTHIVPPDGQPPVYYTNEETAKVAQKVFDDPNYRILFDAASDAKPEDILMAAEMLRRFKEARGE